MARPKTRLLTPALRVLVTGVGLAVISLPACGSDGGGGDGDGDGDGDATTTLRLNAVELLDPHTFALNGGLDVTDTVNEMLLEGVVTDADEPADGLLDFSVVTGFRPLDPARDSVPVDVTFPDCTAPIGSTSCTAVAGGQVISSTSVQADADCLSIDPATLGGYDPAPTGPEGRCFSSTTALLDLAIGDFIIQLEDVTISARFGAGVSLDQGMLVGFLTEAVADATILPDDILVVGGMPLSALLLDADKDTNGATSGWWMYIRFTAAEVTVD